ncbi:MAG: uracil-DNA glycosylase [Clostridia bacterium]|nr:uracil-DNA glycosylase [Clostridia bacterium]
MVQFGNNWDSILADEFKQEYYLKLREFLKSEYSHHTVYPSMYDIFNAFKYTDYYDVKAVILGQDPYHEPNQAHGMAFSVKPGVPTPPSLQNMYKELQDSLGCYIPNNGYLVKWAQQGVLLLNTTLTVRSGLANSHSQAGWQIFTDNVIKKLNERKDPIIFILWGANARRKTEFIDKTRHFVLEAPHPSPLSAYRGFFGCNHFSKTNDILQKLGKSPIDWQIENI